MLRLGPDLGGVLGFANPNAHRGVRRGWGAGLDVAGVQHQGLLVFVITELLTGGEITMSNPYECDIETRFKHRLTFIQDEAIWMVELADQNGKLMLRARTANRDRAILKIRRNLGVPDHIPPLLTDTQRRALTDLVDGFVCIDATTTTPYTSLGGDWFKPDAPHSKESTA